MVKINLSDTQKGILLIIAGSILLFQTLGLFQSGLSFIIITASLCMIGYGFIQADLHTRIQKILKRAQK